MRRISFLASAVSFVIPFTASALGIQVIIDGTTINFVDVSQEAWFAGYVHDAAQAGIVSGYRDASGKLTGKFGPGNSVTIAEALKIAIEGAGYDTGNYSSVIDSGVGMHWAAPYVSVAKGENFAITSGRLRLDQPATRAEVASMFTSAFHVNVNLDAISPFRDVAVDNRNAPAIATLQEDGIVSGDTDANGNPTGMFRPDASINRAEMVKIVLLARQKYGEPGRGRSPVAGGGIEETTEVHYTDGGFSPNVIHATVGTSIRFTNDTTREMWVASDPHPIHDDYQGLDAMQSYGQGETFIFTFSRVGSWGLHNHLNPFHTGTVIVEE